MTRIFIASAQTEADMTDGDVTVDPHPISHNATLKGAANAIADDVRRRISGRPTPLTDAEHAMIAAMATTRGTVTLMSWTNQEIPGIDRGRMLEIGALMNTEYTIAEVELGA